MRFRAEAEQAAAAQLREIAESFTGVKAATDYDQILVTPPKPQPTGGRLIRVDVDPGPVPSPLLVAIRSAIDSEPFGEEPRAAVLAVARWLRSNGDPSTAAMFEEEANK